MFLSGEGEEKQFRISGKTQPCKHLIARGWLGCGEQAPLTLGTKHGTSSDPNQALCLKVSDAVFAIIQAVKETAAQSLLEMPNKHMELSVPPPKPEPSGAVPVQWHWHILWHSCTTLMLQSLTLHSQTHTENSDSFLRVCIIKCANIKLQ